MTTSVNQSQVSADALVNQLNAGKPPSFATPVYDAPPLPASLDDLRTAIAKDPTTSVHDHLMAVVRPAVAFRASVTFNRPMASATDLARQERVFRNMGSGTGENLFDAPSLGLTRFMVDLLTGIATNHIVTGRPATMINERDLFHGHVIPSEATRDLIIVFHSKENPTEELTADKQRMYAGVNLLTPGLADFDSYSPLMNERNFIWTLTSNRIFLLADPGRLGKGDVEFEKLMAPNGDLRQITSLIRRMGTVQERNFGAEVMCVNYFPNQLAGDHTQQAFFLPVGQWAVVARLEKEYPHIPAKEIAEAYRLTDDSLPKTKVILDSY